MKYINLSGYPLRNEDGIVIPVTGHAKVREVEINGDVELTYEGHVAPEEGTIVILPPEADEYSATPPNAHALPDEMTWDAKDRVFDCVLDVYLDYETSEEELDRMEEALDNTIANAPQFQIWPELKTVYSEFPTINCGIEKDTNFASRVMDDCKRDISTAYRHADDRLEELTYIYGKSFTDYARVRDAFKSNLSTEKLVNAAVDSTYIDKFFYNFFGISGRMPQPKNKFQAKVNKEQ